MSDQNPSKSQTSRSVADPRDELSEEVFAWVVTDTSELPEVQIEGSHAAPDGRVQSGGGSGNRQLMVSASALARHMGVVLSEVHSEPGRLGAEPGSDWLASSGLAPLPPAHFQGSGAGHPGFTHALPGIGTGQNVGHAIIPIAPTGGGGHGSGQVPSHIVTGGQPSGPAIAGFIPGGKEGHPVPVLISVVNGNNTPGGSTVTLGGLPPGTTMNQGHAGPGGTWILNPGTDLKNLTMTPPTDWFGSGHLTATVVGPNGHSAQVQLPFNVLPQPDAARISGTDTGTTSEDHILTVSGALTIVDPDPGEAHFHASSLTGSFGHLQIDQSGHWTYSLDNNSPSVQALVSGQSERETFTVHSVDGTGHQLVVNVMGTDDRAIIAGASQGAVTEDKLTAAGGKLDITDPDAGQARFVPQTGAAGAHGSFTVQPDGTWSYTLDNGQPAVQALKTGDQITDTLTVSTVDGTTKQITVTINGTDDKAAIAGTAVGAVTEDKLTAAGGKLDITDPDAGQARFVPQTGAAGAHGSFTVQPDGTWSYALDNGQPAVQALKTGDQITDTLTVSTVDGTTKQITVTINGTDDKAAIAGTAVGAVTEDKLTAAGGKLDITDPDAGQARFVPQTGAAGAHGSFTVQPDGTWSYTLDNGQPAVQALKTGDQITDTLTVSTVDGTTKQITVTINGTDDKAAIAGTAVGAVTEDKLTAAGGKLDITDPDAGQARFVPQTGAAGAHGSFTVQPDGTWSYALDNGQPAVQALKTGDQITDTLTVSTVDGTTKQITVTINGTDDKAAIAGTAVGAVTEDKLTAAGGKLDITDPDAGQARFVPQTGAAGAHGSFTVQPDGTWSYALDNGQPAVQALKTGDQITDTLTVSTVDGTTKQITVTINGTDDKAAIAGTAVGAVTEDKLTATGGKLDITDPDAGQARFVPQTGAAGAHGSFTVQPDGTWSYALDNGQPAVQALKTGDQITDTLTVSTVDGTTKQITVTINGTDDKAAIAGTAVGAVTEDKLTATGGKLDVTDPDAGQARFVPQTGAAGAHGSFTVQPDGTWSYALDNGQPAVQALKTGDQITDTLTVSTVDGTTKQITVTINGTDDKAAIAGTAVGAVTEDKLTAAGGKLDITDPDAGQARFVPQTGAAGAHGSFTVQPDGTWSYTLDNGQPAVQALKTGDQITDTLTVSTVDGTTKQITVTINGTDDKAAIAGTAVGAVTEDKLTAAGGKLDITDPDAGQARFVPQTGAAGAHGSFTVQPDGTWSYALDNGQPAVQALKTGDQITDTLTVSTVDGTTKQITVTINGTDDKAAIAGTAVGAVTEDKLTATGGKLDVTDPDAGQARFVPQTGAAGAHGSFTVQPDGTWSYALDNGQPAVQALKTGDQITDTLTVSTVDGTTKQITVTINGTDDKAAIAGTAVGAVTEDKLTATGGKLDITDPDAGQARFVPQTGAAGAHGSFTVQPDGTWSYTLDNGQPAVQALKTGDQITDTLTVSTVDGTTKQITVTINGTDDKAAIAGTAVGAVTEDKLTAAGGKLDITDPDAGQARFVPQTGAAGAHGSFTVQPDGTWSYALDNGQPAVQALKTGDQITDTLTVSTVDGTTKQITVTINGTDDKAAIAGTAVGAVTEDKLTAAGGKLDITDPDAGQARFVPQTGAAGAHGSFTVQPDGTWSYTLDNGQPAVQALKTGDQITDTLTVSTVDGTTKQITVTINGTDDKAAIAGTAVGAVTEDKLTAAGGKLDITDPDAGQARFVPQTGAAGAHGSFTVQPDGTWSYALDNGQPAVQALKTGDQITDTLTVSTVDGTTKQITVTINGTDDKAAIAGTAVGAVTEDKLTATGGKLDVTDPDAGQARFVPQTGAAGAHGSFTVQPDGTWSYALDNGQPAVQALKTGDQITDTLTVSTVDGTTKQITVTINGTDDKAAIAGTAVGAVTEDKLTATGGKLDITDPDAGQARFVPQTGAAGAHGSFTVQPDGTWSYALDNGQPAVQALKTGDQITDTLTVSTVDGTTKQITVTINGTDDKAAIAGTAVGAVTEDKLTAAGGKLDITDPDAGQARFVPQTGAAGAHGSFTVQPDGTWSYALDNGQPAVQALKTGDQITDTLTVSTVDGTTKQITVTINGTDDKAAIAGTAVGAVTEDKLTAAGGKLDITDPDAGQARFVPQTGAAGAHGSFTVQPDGTWSYTLDNGQPAVQALKTGDQITDTLTVSTVDGTTKQITVTINGTDDKAAIAGTAVGAVTEDKLTAAGGKLDITDPDAGQARFVPQTGAAGAHGSFTVQPDGTWSYALDNGQPAVQALKTGDQITDTLTVSTVDGTTKQITVTINGTDDKAAIAGTAVGAVTEDKLTATGGKLDVTDPDAGQARFVPQTGAAGAHGSFTVQPDGTWSYALDNGQPAVQALKTGDQITDTLTVSTVDGTTKQITVTINGTDDKAAIAGTAVGAVTEDKLTAAGGKLDITDPDAGQARFVPQTGAAGAHGSFTVQPDGTWSYALDNGQPAVQALKTGDQITDTLTVSTVDGTTKQITVTINGTDDKAVISGVSTGTVKEDDHTHHVPGLPVTINTGGRLTVTDADSGEDNFGAAQLVLGTLGGHFVLGASGTWSYAIRNDLPAVQQLGDGETATDTATIHSADGTAHQITVTIQGTNDAPVLTAATASATEDGQSVTGQMSATDVDTGDTLSFAPANPVPGFTLGTDGSWSFDPTDAAYQHLAAGATQQVTIPVTVTDKTGATDTENLVITVTGTNDGPAVSGPVALPGGTEDKPVQITAAQLLEHATDIDTGDTLSVTGLSASHGSISGDAATGFTFTPDANYNGPVALSYQVTDGHGGPVAQTAALTLAATGDAAVIGGVDTGSVTEGTAGQDMSPDYAQPGMAYLNKATLKVDGQLTIIDPDAGEAEFDGKGIGFNYQGQFGDLLLNPDGSWHYNADAGGLRFVGGRPTTRGTAIDQLGDGETLTDTITVHSKDGTPHDIVITIHGSNDRPYCSSEVVLRPGTEDTRQTLTSAQLVGNTVDVDANDAGKLAIANLHPDHGSILDNKDGTYIFTPEKDYNGTVHFTYDVKDAHGGVTHTGATTSLAAVGDVAVITGTDTGAATEDHVQGRIVINGLLSVSDPDGPSQEHFQYSQFGETAVSDPFGGNLHIDSAGGWSYVTYNSNAAIQQLAAGEDGHATYRVRSTDGTTHQIHITIHGTNDTPVLSAATASATEDGKIASGQMSATDVDHGDTQAYSLGQAAPAGFTLSADGSWSFDPTDAAYQHLTANATQQITVPVTVTDSAGETDTQNLVITVTGTNDGPVVSGPVSLPGGTEDKPVQITAAQLLEHATDIDTGDTLSVTGLSASHGSISGDAATGFTFTPDANYNGPVALSYSVTDGQGGTASQTASLALTATGDAAIIGGVDTGSVIENAAGVNMSPDYAQPGIAHLVQAPLYVDGQLTIIDPDAGENSFDTHGVGYNYSGKYGDLLLQANGAWHYLGNAGNIGKGGFATTHGTAIDQLGESQTLTDTITVHAKDGTPHDIVITIHGSNDRPYCSSEVVLPGGTEDTRQTLTTAQLLQNSVDVDKNDAGTLSIANLRSDHGSILDNGNGTFTFTPEHDYNGAVHFNYDVKDAHSGVTHTGASTTLAAVKDSAVITGTDTGSATEDHVAGRIVINGMLSVSDPDGAAQEHFQYSQFGEHAVSDPFGGNLHITSAGSWSYVVNNSNSQIQQLAEGQVGHATYRVASVDGTTHQIEVTITGTNDAPVLSAASASATEDGTQMSGQMSATDVDTGDSQSYSLVQAAPAGFAMGPDGSWTFDPTDAAYQHLTANATQQITVPVTVTDSAGVTDTQNLVITVTGTNDGPVVSGRVSLPGGTEDHAVSISVAQLLEHATDIDTGDTLSVSGLSASHGTITGDAAHGFTFTPDANYNGPVQLSYSVTDGQGGTASQTASLALAATGDAAIIGGVDTGSVTEDKAPGHHSIVGTIATSGALTITDVDGAAQEHFQVQSNVTGSNGYGNFGIDQSGHWTYSANNQQAAIQTLGPGQSLTDTLQVTSTDGTTHNIEVTIHGTIDTPTVGATVGTSQSQPGHASASVAGYTTSSPATIDGMTIHGFAAGQAYETSPGKLADLTGAAGIVGTNLRAMGVDAKEPSAAASITQSHASPQSVDSLMVDPTDKTQQVGETMVLEFNGTTHSAFLELASFGGQGDKVTWKAYGADGSVVAQGEVAGDQSTNPSGRVDLPIQTQQPFAFIAIHAEVPNPVATSHGSAQFTTNVSLASVQAELIRFATPLDLSGGIGDTGDKDQSLVWRVEGLQQAELSAGTRNPDGSWTVTQAEAQGLQMLHSEQQHVQITSIATDAGTGEIAQSAPLQMTVDPAGAKYSVITGTPIIRTDEDHAAPVTGDLDVDSNMAVVPTFVAGTQHTQYGTFQIDTDGHWSFTVDTAKAQGLSEHGIQEHLTVTTTDGSSLDMTVDIAGQNDPGVMTNTTGSGVQGPASVVGGKLVVTDVDTTGGYMFLAGSKFTGNVQGQFGTLDMDQNTGEWTYTVDPTLAAHIPAGQTAEETFSTLSLSSSEHTRLNLTLHVAVDSSGLAKVLQAVTAADVGTVKEDSQVQAGDLVAVGSLSVVNGAQDHIAGIYHGTYGELKLDANGHWSYEASNGQSVIQELKTGEQLTDQISVTGASGQLYNVAITIEGTDDAPVLSAASASATEDGTQVSGQMSATDVDTGDSQSYSLVQAAPAGFAMGPDGSWTFDPTDAAYQHLTANATQQITVPVTVTDSAGVTDTQNLVITVTGTNDGPVVSGRVSLPGGTEDHAVSISVAQLLEHATDIDTGDTLSVSGLSASHGTITGDAAHGFTFTPDANYNGPVQLSYSVTDGQGGTASQTASLALAATGDAAIIGGVDTGSVTEDKAPGHHSIVGTIATSGALTITDVDGAAQEHFQVQSNVTGSNGYGNFGIDQSGHWTYSANNQQAAIQTLGPGQSLTDTLQVTSTDGTTHNIEVTIHGTIDTPTLGATVGTSQSQPGHASAFVAGSSASSPATIDGMTIHGFAAGQAYETSPGKLADLTGAAGIVGTNLRAMGVDAKEPSAAASITQSHASPQYLDSVRVDPTDKTQQLGETMVLEFHGTTHSAFLELTSFGGQGDKVTWKAYGADGSVVAQGEVAGDQSTNPSGRVDLPIQTQQPFAFIAIHAEVPNPVATSSGSAQFTTNVSLASVQAELIRFATPLDLSGGIGDTGDTDQSLVWRVEGLQQAELSAGTHNPDGSWTVTQSEAQGLQILHSEQQHVQITSITTDAGTGEMAQSAPLQMTVDPAGAKYSVITGTPIIRTDEDHAAPVTGDLDVDSNMAVVPTFVAGTQHTQYGTFQIDTDGHWSFTVDTAKAQGLSQSGSQEHLTVTTTDGSSLDMTVDIAGDNDPGVMTNTTGSGVQGPASVVGGKLVVTDVDTTGGYMFLAGSKFTGNVQGQFGTLDMDQNTGEWTYTVDPTLAAQIPAGQTAEETFSTLSLSSSERTRLSLTLHVAVDSSGQAKVLQAVTASPAAPAPAPSADEPDLTDTSSFAVTLEPAVDGHDHDNPLLRSDMDDPAALQPRGPVDAAPAMASQHDAPEQVTPKDHEESGHQDGDTNLGHDANAPRAEQGVTDTAEHAVNIEEHSPHLEIEENSANAPGVHEGTGPEALDERLGESVHSPHDSDLLNPYLDAIGANQQSDTATPSQDYDHANPYITALGVDASMSTDAPVVDPTTLDDPVNAEVPNSDAASDHAEADLPPDDPIVPLPEDDDPSTNLG